MAHAFFESGFGGARVSYSHDFHLGATVTEQRGHSGIAGGIFGLIVFIAGGLLLAFTFKLAIELFGKDPNELFGLQSGKPLDLNKAGATLAATVVRVLLLLIMAIVGGMIANRGIRLYADSRGAKHATKE